MLRLENVGASYGKSPVLQGIDLHVAEGEFVTLIGANGAGKTTTLRSISGIIPSRTGRIFFCGEEITSAPAGPIVRAGLTHSPEGRGIFPMMTVYENLQVGGHSLRTPNDLRAPIALVFEYLPHPPQPRAPLPAHLSTSSTHTL